MSGTDPPAARNCSKEHTGIDCWERRNKRGYLFIIGDEMPYPGVKPREVSAWIGDEIPQPIAIRNLIAQLTRRWDTYYILPEGASYVGDRQVLGAWHGLLGQNVIELADLDAVCETITLTVGLGEEAIDLDEGLVDLWDVGSTAGSTVGRALASIGAAHGDGKGRGDRAPRALPAPRPSSSSSNSSGNSNTDSNGSGDTGGGRSNLPPGSVLR